MDLICFNCSELIVLYLTSVSHLNVFGWIPSRDWICSDLFVSVPCYYMGSNETLRSTILYFRVTRDTRANHGSWKVTKLNVVAAQTDTPGIQWY